MLIIPSVPEHEWIETEDQATALLRECLKREYVAVDTETTGTNKVSSRVVDWSLAYPGRRVCLPAKLLPLFNPFFVDPATTKVMHNAKFDMHMLANNGISVEGTVHDTHVMSVLDNTERKPHTLKYLCGEGLFDKGDPRHLHYDTPFGGRIKNYNDLQNSIGADKAREYASLDAIATLFVYEELKSRLEEAPAWEGSTMWDFFQKEEVPFTRVLFNCERRGITVDVGYLQEKQVEAETALDSLAETFCTAAGEPMTLNSTPQLRRFFFELRKKTPLSYTSGGASGNKQPSLDAHTLKKWAEHGDPYAITLLEYRTLMKLNGTYLKGLLKLADHRCRVHSTLNQGGTETGRISSSEPNLQNIPRPSGDIFNIRGAFVAAPGMVLIDADYDQLEMKLMADMASEEAMIEAINNGRDIHTSTAALMFGVDYDNILAAKKAKDKGKNISAADRQLLTYRQQAKTIGFGLNYGEGPTKLADQLGITFQEAQGLIDLYFQPYPNIKRFIDDIHEYVLENGFVRTMSGRARHLRDGIESSEDAMVAQALRRAVNAVIQGSAADVVRKAMVMCDNDQRLQDLGCRQLLQIHDELIFECPEENAKQAMDVIQELMESPYKDILRVELTAGPHAGLTWTEAK
jgi:DNA polymerase-1